VVVLSPRPGRVISVVPVDFPRPRSPGLLREPAFHACCDGLTQLLFAGGDPAHPDRADSDRGGVLEAGGPGHGPALR
jgi:NitT/TauT family transport system ATP-binding protein